MGAQIVAETVATCERPERGAWARTTNQPSSFEIPQRSFSGEPAYGTGLAGISAGKPAQEFTLIHAVLESFATVYEDYRDFVGELTAQ